MNTGLYFILLLSSGVHQILQGWTRDGQGMDKDKGACNFVKNKIQTWLTYTIINNF